MRRQTFMWATVAALAGIACGVTGGFGDATARGCRIAGDFLPDDVEIEIPQPAQCRYTIFKRLETVDLTSKFGSDNPGYIGKTYFHDVLAGGFLHVMSTVQVTWQEGGACLQDNCMTLDGSFTAGTIDEGTITESRFREIYEVRGPNPSSNLNAAFRIELIGGIGRLASIAGDDGFTAPDVTHWRAIVDLDTGSYTYKWHLNGNLVQNGGRTYFGAGFGESGTYSLMAIAKLHDNSTDTVTRSIVVDMGAAWTGPTEIGNGENGVWQAIGYAARLPFSSCEWSIDYSVVQTGSCSLSRSFATPQTVHTIDVTITDARGVTAFGSNMVWVHTAGCTPPDCYEMLRVPSGSKRRDKPRIVPRD